MFLNCDENLGSVRVRAWFLTPMRKKSLLYHCVILQSNFKLNPNNKYSMNDRFAK